MSWQKSRFPWNGTLVVGCKDSRMVNNTIHIIGIWPGYFFNDTWFLPLIVSPFPHPPKIMTTYNVDVEAYHVRTFHVTCHIFFFTAASWPSQWNPPRGNPSLADVLLSGSIVVLMSLPHPIRPESGDQLYCCWEVPSEEGILGNIWNSLYIYIYIFLHYSAYGKGDREREMKRMNTSTVSTLHDNPYNGRILVVTCHCDFLQCF